MSIDALLAFFFVLFLCILLYARRKAVVVQKLLFPLLYLVMYRTRIGLRGMDSLARRHPRLVQWFGYLAIAVGFVGMAVITFEVARNVLTVMVSKEAVPGVGIVAPFKLKGVFFVPFIYWILSIFIIAAVHEFAHGVVARRYGIRIKSSGFAFLSVLVPVLPAAFVEPDEKQLKRKPMSQQLSMLGAGPLSNILLGLVVLAVLIVALQPATNAITEVKGLEVIDVANETLEGNLSLPGPAYAAGIRAGHLITSIDLREVESLDDFSASFRGKGPGDTVLVVANETSFPVVLGTNPKNGSAPFLGVTVSLSTGIRQEAEERFGFWIYVFLWVRRLLEWLFFLNIGIGLFNLVPLGPIDGGRMSLLVLERWWGQERGQRIWKNVSMVFLAMLLVLLGASFLR